MLDEKPLSLNSIQKQSLLNVLEQVEKKGIDLNEILPERMLQCLELFKLGRSYKEIGLDMGITGARVQQMLTGTSKSALILIRRHLQPRPKQIYPNRDEIISQIKSVNVNELHCAIERLKKPALMNIYREIMKEKIQ
ncbi:hypothetical protein [Paenibacillus polymyxa]|uniref:hypothetical protein n=1 Tax=Paenibacillus polymyxa TaxID=1406 RepID=UPI0025B64789|nr:hypothetical protein [Paenibacillus polymyxa]MDN4090951.1 hypothetical protein [Paenibacillus polymyxa]